MSRRVQIVLLCEDTQHEACLRRFLFGMGWEMRAIRVEKAVTGRGSADQFVRQQFPRELKAHRTRHASQAFVTMMDGDRYGVEARLGQLNEACRAGGVDVRSLGERVAVFVPTWSIETGFAYLDGATVDEVRSDYPRLPKERDCQRHVAALADRCRARALRQPCPPSLEMACDEYRARLVEGTQ